MKKITKAGFFVAAATAATVMIGGTMAYLTDYDTVSNQFTVGKVDIELTEPSWKPEENTSVEPLGEINKDPQITNTGKNDAYVYLEVSVPMRKLITADENGNRIDPALIQLFTFSPQKNWTLMDSLTEGNNKVYRYSYDKILTPGEKTNELFKTMQFANVVEGQIDGQTFDVPVHAYAIQSTNTGGDKKTVSEQAKNAFEKYLNQNKKSGKD